MSSIAFAMPLGAVLLSEQLRLGEFTISRVFGWTTVGVVVLGSQFAVGAIKPNQRMWRLLLGECGVVYAGLFAVLTFSDGGVSLAATLYLAGVGSLLFLAFGGPLYLLGHHLSDASR